MITYSEIEEYREEIENQWEAGNDESAKSLEIELFEAVLNFVVSSSDFDQSRAYAKLALTGDPYL